MTTKEDAKAICVIKMKALMINKTISTCLKREQLKSRTITLILCLRTGAID